MIDERRESTAALKLWIFTPDLTISSSARSTTDPVRVVKVLWQDSDAATGDSEKLGGPTSSEGELRVRKEVVAMLRETLARTTQWLPEAARRFQDWHVGLLERFTTHDIESA